MTRRGSTAGAVGLLLIIVFARMAMAAPGDLVIPRNPAATGTEQFPAATFPHTLHRVLYKCYVCHDSLFKMKRGADAITMKTIEQDKFCGACHDGKITFDAESFDNCGRCHQQ